MPDFSNLRKPFYWKAADLSGKEINNTQMRNVINADPTISATRTCQSVHTRPKSGDIQVTIQFDDDLTTPAQTDALTTLLTGAGYTYQAVGTGRVFQAYTTTSVNTYTTSWIDVEFDVQNVENIDIYSHTTGTAEVTFLAAGDYEVYAKVSSDNLGSNRNESTAALFIDEGGGSGFEQVGGSVSYAYHRTSVNGKDSATVLKTISGVQSGHKLVVRVKSKNASNALKLISDACLIRITKL